MTLQEEFIRNYNQAIKDNSEKLYSLLKEYIKELAAKAPHKHAITGTYDPKVGMTEYKHFEIDYIMNILSLVIGKFKQDNIYIKITYLKDSALFLSVDFLIGWQQTKVIDSMSTYDSRIDQ